MDYWLVPRVVGGVQTMEKVVPVSQTNAGTVVHDVEEVKDYFLTPSAIGCLCLRRAGRSEARRVTRA
jgi:hypothetical protein